MKIGHLLLAMVIVPTFLTACNISSPPSTEQPQTLTLKVVSFLPAHISTVRFTGVLAEKVEERSKGELIIDWIGGPEAIPRGDQAEALRTGVVDMITHVASELDTYVPEGRALLFSGWTPKEEREYGLYDFLNELYQRNLNAYYLGRERSWGPFVIYTNIRTETPEQLTGQSIACSPSFTSIAEALGMVPLIMPTEERYTAMERGLADAGYTSLRVGVDNSWAEVADYFIEPGFHSSSNVIFLINMDRWTALPEHLQDLLKEVVIEVETEEHDFFLRDASDARRELIDADLEPIEFSPEDAERFLDIINNVTWEEIRAGSTPESFSQLQIIMSQ